MPVFRLLLNLVKKIGQGVLKEVDSDDEGTTMSTDTDTSAFRKKEKERQKIKPFTSKKFECNVPPYILEKKDVLPHERYMLESQSIVAQKVDFLMECLGEQNEYMRELERELIAIRRWKGRFTRRVALLIVLLIAFLSYVAPLFHTEKSGQVNQQTTNAPVRTP